LDLQPVQPSILPGDLRLSQLESHLWESANILRGPVVDAADFDAAWAEGRALTMEQVIELAMKVGDE
jgi:hypothetical protein